MDVLRVLLLEDSVADAELVSALLEEAPEGAEVEHCTTLGQALACLSREPVDVVLADLSLPDACGLEAVHALRRVAPDLPIVVLSGLDDDATAVRALAAGAQDYVGKDGLTARLLLSSLRYAGERARSEHERRVTAQWTAALLDGLEAPTCAVDSDGRVLTLNAALRADDALLPVSCRTGDDLPRVLRDTRVHGAALGEGLRSVLSGEVARFEHECCSLDSRWWSVRITSLPGGSGAVVTQVDVTVLKHAQEQLSAAALHDALTGLPNRTLLNDRLDRAFAHAARTDQVIGVVLLDLDRFKLVNDTLGHAGGDAVLVAVAQRLLTAARSTETVARVSSDEYVVVFVIDDEADAPAVARRLLTAVNGPLLVDGREVPLSAAAGLAVAAPGETAEEVLRTAGEAMHAAKARGGGRLVVASGALRDELLRRVAVEAALERAIAGEGLEVLYQPVVRLVDGVPTGVEALARLQGADGRLVPPAEFIDVAERSGLIVPLGAKILEIACQQASSWTDEATEHTVAVNLSTRQLAQPDIVATVAACLSRSGLPPCRLVLEVTESAVVEDADAALASLTGLKGLGVGIAIDDFGTGYASFQYLKQFPVDLLKIDGSFVAGMLDSVDDAAIVASIVRLGLDVGVGLIAEGVETEAQRRHLLGLGCTDAQGYLFAVPASAADLPAARSACSRAPGGRSTPPALIGAALTARILALHRGGASVHTIAAVLNSEGVPSPAGRRWHPATVTRQLADAAVRAGS